MSGRPSGDSSLALQRAIARRNEQRERKRLKDRLHYAQNREKRRLQRLASKAGITPQQVLERRAAARARAAEYGLAERTVRRQAADARLAAKARSAAIRERQAQARAQAREALERALAGISEPPIADMARYRTSQRWAGIAVSSAQAGTIRAGVA